MISFGLKNLRRLVSVPPVEIKPITILVGRNSSGKSSFLRALPLLRQSLMTQISSPVLWYGDFVDFGSFQGSVTDNNVDNVIGLTFGVDELLVPDIRGPYYHPPRPGKTYSAELEVSIGLVKDSPTTVATNEKTQIASLCLRVVNEEIDFLVQLNNQNEISSLLMNGHSVLEFFSEFQLTLSQGTVFPEIVMRPRDPVPTRFYAEDYFQLSSAMGKMLSPYLHGRIKRGTLDRYAGALLSLPNFTKETLQSLSNEIQAAQSFKSLLADVASSDMRHLYEKLLRIYRANRFIPIFNRLCVHLRDTISSTLYIGPARAPSERYYRHQDLSVSEIDSDGTNFPMFLSSLNTSQLAELSNWVEALFKYRIEIKASAGHLSINLTEGEYSTNIVDTGYGVSQILPVLGQIWWAANRPRLPPEIRRLRRRERTSILAIEQPELHLHPAHQALLADAIAAQSQKQETTSPLHFMVETHSETLVNRLGELISERKLDPETVQILIFEPDDSDARITRVGVARFGAEGELIDWPYGFFQAPARR